MRVLVACASKYGATEEIAERIGERLRTAGIETDVRGVASTERLTEYDAFVVGGAVYMGHWLKDATEFVRGLEPLLTECPVWLFASGPLGNGRTGGGGADLKAAAPKEFAEFEAIKPRDSRVFPGALVPRKLNLLHRAIRLLPAGRRLLPPGDFRDWRDVEGWADGIADELTQRQGEFLDQRYQELPLSDRRASPRPPAR